MKTRFFLALFALLFLLGKTWYFGWNWQPSCNAERVCDIILSVIFFSIAISVIVERTKDFIVKEIKKELNK